MKNNPPSLTNGSGGFKTPDNSFSMYCLPKLHKKPYKARFIDISRSCDFQFYRPKRMFILVLSECM